MLTTSVTLMYCNDICIPRDRVLLNKRSFTSAAPVMSD